MAINDQVTMNPPVLVTILKLRVLGLHVIYILCYVMRSIKRNIIESKYSKSNRIFTCLVDSPLLKNKHFQILIPPRIL